MHIPFKIPITVAFLVGGSLHAQIPEYRFEFVPTEVETDYNRKAFAKLDEAATIAHVVRLERPLTGKAAKEYFLYCFSRETGERTGSTRFGGDWGKGMYYDRLLVIDDRFYVILEDVDHKTGEVKVVAQQYELPALQTVGERLLIATITFDPKTLSMYSGFGSEFLVSEDGEHVVFFFDRIKSQENEQLVLLSAMDKDLTARWNGGYQIPFESEKIVTVDKEVSNEGIVYALMRSRFKGRSITNRAINYSFELFGMLDDSFAKQPVSLPSGYTALRANLVLKKGAPRVAGFYVEPEQTVKETAGYFVADFLPTLGEAPIVSAPRLKTPLEYQLMVTNVLQRPDGGTYLIGGSWELAGTGIEERMLVAVSIGEEQEREWETVIPRKLKSSVVEDYGYKAFVAGNSLLLLFPDGTDNLALYQAREQPRLMTSSKRVIVAAGFDDAGSPTFAEFKSEPYNLSLGGFDEHQVVTPGLILVRGSRPENKKDVTQGMLYLTLESKTTP